MNLGVASIRFELFAILRCEIRSGGLRVCSHLISGNGSGRSRGDIGQYSQQDTNLKKPLVLVP